MPFGLVLWRVLLDTWTQAETVSAEARSWGMAFFFLQNYRVAPNPPNYRPRAPTKKRHGFNMSAGILCQPYASSSANKVIIQRGTIVEINERPKRDSTSFFPYRGGDKWVTKADIYFISSLSP